ncbi:MAG: SHIRT domain-containing protein [Erysipelotrichaceae bacterium]|nr:SHIRT domain-containing protein [Erysipelotrichaceae bacterium]
MKKLLSVILIFFVVLSSNIKSITAEEYVSIDFVFESENGDELPEEIMDLLPEPINSFTKGETLSLSSFDDVTVNDLIYTFTGWDHNDFVVDADTTVKGIWKPKENTTVSQYTVHYEFVEAGANGKGYLPQEIYDLLPEDEMINTDDYPNPPSLADDSLQDYVFLGWNTPVLEVTTGVITVQGVWMYTLEKTANGIMLLAAAVTSGLGSAWSYVRNDGTGGYSRYQYTINGEPAWCVEPEVSGWPLAGTGYDYYGQYTNKVAEIIGMGLRNNMSAGAIQAAIDNYANHSASSSDGMDTNPNSSNYSTGGSYACRIDVYTPTGYEGEIQRLGTNPVCWPLNPKLTVQKKSSSSFNYTSNCPGMYSLAGAVYGVYSDLSCTNQVATLTTTSSGSSNPLELSAGTYYVKEISPSKGFKLDPKIYTAILSAGNSQVVVSSEDPYDDPTVVQLIKKSSNPNGYTKYLDTAEFTLRYYDTYTYTDTLTPKLTWVFKPIIKNGEAVVEFDRAHYVSGPTDLFDSNGVLKIPMGTFTIEETKAPQTYLRDPEVYVGRIYLDDNSNVLVEINGGVNLTIENEQLTQDEKVIILKTSATVKENGQKEYPADGVAHIDDLVVYENLDSDREYLLKTKLIDRLSDITYWTIDDFDNGLCNEEDVDTIRQTDYSIGSVIAEYETLFTPDDTGMVTSSYEINLDEYANHEFVIFEYLYAADNPDELISYHEDLTDMGQSIRILPLYEAEFVLYKVSNVSKDIRLSGAFFDVSTRRVKRDNTLVENYLGKYVSGGIYYEADDSFTLYVYSDEEMSEVAGIYASSYDSRFSKQCVIVLDLQDGTYYAKMDTETDLRKWVIEKGAIYLDSQLEDTKITFKEIIAPVGYHLDSSNYVVDVGHDTSLTRVENYRINAMIIPYKPPVTGVD